MELVSQSVIYAELIRRQKNTETHRFKNRPLVRNIHRWEDNIKMDLREIAWEFTDWMLLVQDRNRWRAVVYTVMNLRVL
jgi:hypothetical protein